MLKYSVFYRHFLVFSFTIERGLKKVQCSQIENIYYKKYEQPKCEEKIKIILYTHYYNAHNGNRVSLGQINDYLLLVYCGCKLQYIYTRNRARCQTCDSLYIAVISYKRINLVNRR